MNETFVLEQVIAVFCFGASAGILLGTFIHWALALPYDKEMRNRNNNQEDAIEQLAKENHHLRNLLFFNNKGE